MDDIRMYTTQKSQTFGDHLNRLKGLLIFVLILNALVWAIREAATLTNPNARELSLIPFFILVNVLLVGLFVFAVLVRRFGHIQISEKTFQGILKIRSHSFRYSKRLPIKAITKILVDKQGSLMLVFRRSDFKDVFRIVSLDEPDVVRLIAIFESYIGHPIEIERVKKLGLDDIKRNLS